MPGVPATTPRLQLPRFSGADPADFPAQLNQLADALDLRVPPLVGTFANRPATAAGQSGRLYFATDRDSLYIESNGVWRYLSVTALGYDVSGNRARAVPDPATEYELLFDQPGGGGDALNKWGLHPGLTVVGGRISITNDAAGQEIQGYWSVFAKVSWNGWPADGTRRMVVGPGFSSDLDDSRYSEAYNGINTWQSIGGVVRLLAGESLKLRVWHSLPSSPMNALDWAQITMMKL